MPYIKRFSISGSPFWGWHTDIDLDDMNSINDIASEVKTRLLSWIERVERLTEQNDLYGLREAVNNWSCFFHGMKFGDLLTSDEPVIYLCQCAHEEDPQEPNAFQEIN